MGWLPNRTSIPREIMEDKCGKLKHRAPKGKTSKIASKKKKRPTKRKSSPAPKCSPTHAAPRPAHSHHLSPHPERALREKACAAMQLKPPAQSMCEQQRGMEGRISKQQATI